MANYTNHPLLHGHANRGAISSTYSIWQMMKQRCQNPNCAAFKYYGGRGIRVCRRWQSFAPFLQDMGARPARMTIERIDNDGPYSPSNCRWATQAEQTRNRRGLRPITWRGRTLLVAEWARELRLKPVTVYMRLYAGMPLNRVFWRGDFRKDRLANRCVR